MSPNPVDSHLAHLPDGPDIQALAGAALESSYDSILITGPDLDHPEIVYVNPACCRMTGYAREEVIGRTPAILQGSETDHSATRRLRAALEAGRNEEARKAAESFRSQVAGTEFHDEISVTASFGVAQYRREEDESARELFERADKALYPAKSLGRNRVCSARESAAG